MVDMKWYNIDDVDTLDTPAFVIYEQRMRDNIDIALDMVDNDTHRFRPHVKTHKSLKISEILISKGISKFKCATISEAEMLALALAPDILLAYQPQGPKINRLISLIKKYPHSKFSCLIDNIILAENLSKISQLEKVVIDVYVDINVGMNRTGIDVIDAFDFYKHCSNLDGLNIKGLHAYDGHIRDSNIKIRVQKCDEAFEKVEKVKSKLTENGFSDPIIIVGGSPSFPIHAKRKNVECSPGTFIFWDAGYRVNLPDQHFQPAALVISRIISFPGVNLICLDLGHKSIASENTLDKRVRFINAPELEFISHSEEHLVVKTDRISEYKIGQVLYGIPYHVCPTTALFEKAQIVNNGKCSGTWEVTARNRSITI